MEKRKRFPKIDGASLLETMLAAPDELIVVVNKNGYIENMSQAYGDFLGIQVQNAIGRHVTEVIENTRMDIVVKTGVPETGETQDIHGEKMIATRIPIRKNGMVIGAYGRVLVRNTRELHMLHDKLSSIEMELNMYKRTFEKINTAKYTVDDIIGDCSIMQDLKDSVRKVAKTNSNVLIMGESGTGKELAAHAIHSAGKRSKGPFISLNCAALPENLIESELFGHEKGAFTGASGIRKGRFELADGGTLFLDEVGELSLLTQAKLLRVLQERCFERLGGTESLSVDVRIITATNRDLARMVEEGTFRRDLYYRLNVFPIHMPPLRERQNDIQPLAAYFVDKYAAANGRSGIRISLAVMDMLQRYSWPGNIRELENVMERAVLLVGQDGLILPQHLPRELHSTHCPFGPEAHKGPVEPYTASGTLQDRLDELERACITDALARHKGHMGHAAQALGLTERVMALRMKKHGISYKDFRQH